MLLTKRNYAGALTYLNKLYLDLDNINILILRNNKRNFNKFLIKFCSVIVLISVVLMLLDNISILTSSILGVVLLICISSFIKNYCALSFYEKERGIIIEKIQKLYSIDENYKDEENIEMDKTSFILKRVNLNKIMTDFVEKEIIIEGLNQYYFIIDNKGKDKYFSKPSDELNCSLNFDGDKNFELLFSIDNHNEKINILLFMEEKLSKEEYNTIYKLFESKVCLDLNQWQKHKTYAYVNLDLNSFLLKDVDKYSKLHEKIHLLIRENKLRARMLEKKEVETKKVRKKI